MANLWPLLKISREFSFEEATDMKSYDGFNIVSYGEDDYEAVYWIAQEDSKQKMATAVM